MLLDLEALFSDDQAITTAGTHLCTNPYDMGAAALDSMGNTVPKDIGRSRNVEILVQVSTTFTSGGAATLQVDIISDDDAALGSPTVLQSSAAIPVASLVAGYQFRLALPAGISERYLGVQYTIGTAAMTAGALTAGLIADKQTAPGV